MIQRKFFVLLLLSLLLACFLSVDYSQAHIATTLNDGLVLYYNFNEGTGTAVIDQTIFNNNGTLTGTTYTTTPFIYGTGLNFSSDPNSIVSTTTLTGVSNNTVGSVSFWINVVNWEAAVSYWSVFNNWNYYFNFMGDESGKFQMHSVVNGVETYSALTDAGLNENTNYLITACFNGTHILTYANQNLIKTAPYTVWFNDIGGSSLHIGDVASYGWFNGLMDDFRIYNRVLTADEIAQLYAGQTQPIKILCLGDSITTGFSYADPTYPETLSTLLDGVVVVNGGVDGATTNDLIPSLNTTWANQEYTDIVVLAGINDVLEPCTLTNIEGNLTLIYEIAHNIGLNVYACTVTPYSHNVGILNLNTWIKYETPEYVTVIDAFSALVNSVDGYILKAEYNSGDNLHLSQAGADMLAYVVAQAFSYDLTPSPSPSPVSSVTQVPISEGEVSNAMLFVLGFMVVMCVVGLVLFGKVPIVVLLIGLFTVLVGLYCGLGGVYSLGVAQGWFSLFVALFGGLIMLLVGLGVRVRR